MAIQCVVSPCNSNVVQVRDEGNMDLCLTINPIIENKSSISYNCEGLPKLVTGNGLFKLEEPGNRCMSRLRAYANSAGISLNRPIEFGYSLENDQSGQLAMIPAETDQAIHASYRRERPGIVVESISRCGLHFV